jgi:rhodanese-related sulfurtransferase
MALHRMTKEELKERIEASDEAARPVLVDARLKYPYEHSTVQLPGAVRFAPSDGPMPQLPTGRDLVVYDSDPNEITAVKVAAGLLKAGHRVSVLKGGLAEWVGANLATESKSAIRPAPAPAPAPAATPAAPAATATP